MITWEQLVGTWSLTEYVTATDGTFAPAYRNVVGRLIYSAGAQMAAVISGETLAGEFYQLAYAGTVELREGQVLHHVVTATRRSFIGQTFSRQATLSGDVLVLTTPTTPAHRLTWTKVA